MAKRKKTPEMGGAPHIDASGFGTARDLTETRDGFTNSKTGKPLKGAQQSLSLSIGAEAEARGEAFLEEVRRVIKMGPTREGIQQLASLVQRRRDLVLRVPEFHEYMGQLAKDGWDQAVAWIMGDRQGRAGRPHDPHYAFQVIALVDQVRRQEGFNSDAKAAQWIRAHLPAFPMGSAGAIQNLCSAWRRKADVFYGSIYIKGEQLTSAGYRSPKEPGRKKR